MASFEDAAAATGREAAPLVQLVFVRPILLPILILNEMSCKRHEIP